MIHEKQKPVGVDIKVQGLQHLLHAKLLPLWGLVSVDYDCFGRAYRFPVKGGHVPQVYVGNGQYADPCFNDNIVLTSFFGVPTSTKVDLKYSIGQTHLIFCMNLESIRQKAPKYSAIQHRIDEEVHQDVLAILKQRTDLANVLGVEVWVENVFREYSSYRTQDRMQAKDVHPFHAFRVNLEMKYENSNC